MSQRVERALLLAVLLGAAALWMALWTLCGHERSQPPSTSYLPAQTEGAR